MNFNLQKKDLYLAATILNWIHMQYAFHFSSKTRNAIEQSRQYVQGILLGKGRGNMCRYARSIPDCDNQTLHHFISESPWDERTVIDHIQNDITKLMGDSVDGSIHIDESGFPKQGNNSVGVKRQYCGRLGKVENCQVGVFLGYSKGSYRTLIDGRLYLPKDWAEDLARRKKCGVPDGVIFKSKAEIALEMVLHARENDVIFKWVGMDSFYGEQTWLRNRLDAEGLIFIADIPSDTRVWLSLPKTGIPARKSGRGRTPTKERVLEEEQVPIEVSTFKERIDPPMWNHFFIRDTERKELWSNVACIRVYPVDDGLPGKELWLIIRRDDGENTVKYQLSNAPLDISFQQLAKMSCSRYWIERAFEDAKGIAGLADYEVRSWTGWHHHITMSMLAMLALLMLDLQMGKKTDLLTVQDVKEILEVILPKKKVDENEIINIIKQKHMARDSARRSHHHRIVQRSSEHRDELSRIHE
jgi:SRSO17 transposase